MIEIMPFYQLRADESFTLADRLLTILQNHASEASTIQPLIEKLLAAKQLLDASLVKSSTKLQTEKVLEWDKLRDDAFIAFRDYIQVCNRRVKDDWKAPSQLILNTIKNYGWQLYKENYSVESSKIKNLVSELETNADLVAALATLNGSEWKDELKNAQAGFDAAVEERTAANSKITLSQTKAACKEIETACQSIFKYLEVMNEIAPQEEVTTLIEQINVVIREFTNVINIRTGKRVAAQSN